MFVKCYGFLFIAKNMGTSIDENINKNIRGKYGQKRVDHAKQSATDVLKTSSIRVIKKKKKKKKEKLKKKKKKNHKKQLVI